LGDVAEDQFQEVHAAQTKGRRSPTLVASAAADIDRRARLDHAKPIREGPPKVLSLEVFCDHA